MAPTTLPVPARSVVELRYIERITGGASSVSPLPLVVVMHGLGDSPEGISGLFRDFDAPARVILPAAPDPWGDGSSWFPVGPEAGAARIRGIERSRRAVLALLDRLGRERPTRERAVVTGFSQGGYLSFDLALHAPNRIALAVPLSGTLPAELVPASIPAVRIVALHGADDRRVPVDATRALVARLRAGGAVAEIRTFPGLGHDIDPAMRDALFGLVREAVVAH